MQAKKHIISAVGLSLAALAGNAHAAVIKPIPQTVTDHSFETAVMTGAYTYAPAGTGLTFSAKGSGIATNGSAFGFTNAPDGKNVAFVQGQGSFATKFYGNLIKGATYQLSFDAEGRSNPFSADAIGVSIHGDEIFGVVPTTGSFTNYTTDFKYYGDNSLEFSGLIPQSINAARNHSQDFSSAIDNIGVTLIASPVPETGTWIMMILGFGAIGGMMRLAHRKSEERFTRKVRSLAAA